MKARDITAIVLGSFLLLTAELTSAAEDWRNLSPRERERVRQNIDRWEKLPPRDKDRVRDARKYYEGLPKDQRDQIRQRYDDQRRRDRDRGE
jgi:phage-related tail protein